MGTILGLLRFLAMPNVAYWLSFPTMPERQEARFLRERAQRLRNIAATHQTPLSDELRIIAEELEGRAAELEKGPSPDDFAGLL